MAEVEMDLVVKNDDRDLRAALALHARKRRKVVKGTYGDMVVLIAFLSQDGRRYRREATGQMRAIVSEVHSGPRVTATAKRHPRLGFYLA